MKLRGYVVRLIDQLRDALPPLLCDAVGLGGCGLIAYGAWLAYPPSGFIVAGAMAVTGAWLLGARRG